MPACHPFVRRAAVLTGLLALLQPSLACPPPGLAPWSTLTIAAALARVSDCHPDVRAARAALVAAQADTRTARQRPNPSLTITAGNLGSGGLGAGTLWAKTFDHQLRLDQLVERGGKPGLRRAAADALQDAAAADVGEAQRQARLALSRGWFDLRAAAARREQLAASVALNTESMRLLAQRVKAGDAAPLDATRFALDDSRAQADLAQADADRRSLALQLALALGGGAADAADLATAVAAAPPYTPATAEAEAKAEPAPDRRADIVAALARVRAAEFARDLAASLATRDISVGMQLDHWPNSAASPAGTGNTVSLSVNFPLLSRHAYQGEAARAQADLATAQEALRRARETALGDLARSQALALAASERQRLVVEQLEPAAERVASGAELAWRHGASSALELLESRRSLRAVRIERVNADAEAAKAQAEIVAARSSFDGLIAP